MAVKEKLRKLLDEAHDEYYKQFDPTRDFYGMVADHLIANGVTFAKDMDVPSKWISVEDEKPKKFVSVLGHMTDARNFPTVQECFWIGEAFFFPALGETHPVDKWAYMPKEEDNGK